MARKLIKKRQQISPVVDSEGNWIVEKDNPIKLENNSEDNPIELEEVTATAKKPTWFSKNLTNPILNAFGFSTELGQDGQYHIVDGERILKAKPLSEWTTQEKLDHPIIHNGLVDEQRIAHGKKSASGSAAADLETFNAVTGGAMQLVDPNQMFGNLWNLGKVAVGGEKWDPSLNDGQGGYRDMTYTDFANDFMENSGIVSDKFNEEYPYWSMAINGVFDVGNLYETATGTARRLFSPRNVRRVASDITTNASDARRVVSNVSKNATDVVDDIPFRQMDPSAPESTFNPEMNQDIVDAYTDYAKNLGKNKSELADAQLVERWAQHEAPDEVLTSLGIEDIPTFRSEGVPSAYKKDFYDLDHPIPGYGDWRLSTKDLLYQLGQTTKPKELFSQDMSAAYKFLKEDSLPRLLRNLEQQGIDLDAYPGLRDEITDLYTNPQDYYTTTQEWVSPRYGGASYADGSIKYPRGEEISPATFFHENHHSLRTKVAQILAKREIEMPDIDYFDDLASMDADRMYWHQQDGHAQYTAAEQDAMRLGKGFDFDVRKSLTPDREIGATSAESRFQWALEHPDADGNILYGDALDEALDAAESSGELGEWIYRKQPSYTGQFEDLDFNMMEIYNDPQIRQAVANEARQRIPKSFLERLGLPTFRTNRRLELERDLMQDRVDQARKEFLKPVGSNALTRMKVIAGGLPAAVGVGTVLRDPQEYKSGGKLKLIKKCKSGDTLGFIDSSEPLVTSDEISQGMLDGFYEASKHKTYSQKNRKSSKSTDCS